MELRFARSSDVPAMLAIYAQYIDTSITFETVLPSEEEFAGRLSFMTEEYLWLVAEENGRVLGYAYAHRPWERAAYHWNAELSVYLDQDFHRHGLGTRLYKAMLALLKAMHARVAYGVITVPNDASIGMHTKLGFTEAARFARAGWKNQAWHDVVWLALPLADDDAEPEPLVPCRQLDPMLVRRVLAGR